VRWWGIGSVGVVALGFARDLHSPTGIPPLISMLGMVLVGFLVLTRRGSEASGRDLILGSAGGMLAALVWSVPLLFGPVPSTGARAILVMTATAGVFLLPYVERPRWAVRTSCSILVAALAIIATVQALAHDGAARFVPPLTPAAGPADRLLQSRIEMVDPYVAVLFLASCVGALLGLELLVRKSSHRLSRAARA
jgi:hypothetical protein